MTVFGRLYVRDVLEHQDKDAAAAAGVKSSGGGCCGGSPKDTHDPSLAPSNVPEPTTADASLAAPEKIDSKASPSPQIDGNDTSVEIYHGREHASPSRNEKGLKRGTRVINLEAEHRATNFPLVTGVTSDTIDTLAFSDGGSAKGDRNSGDEDSADGNVVDRSRVPLREGIAGASSSRSGFQKPMKR